MKRRTLRATTQLAVIGTGIAGFAASIFARQRGLDVAQFGHTGAISYTTGYLDLLGVQDGHILSDPWAGLDHLRQKEPDHPLGFLPNDDIGAAFSSFTDNLSAMGIGYTEPGNRNLAALLPYGVTKPTCSVPATMRPGIDAMQRAANTLIVDFEGLQGFSAQEFRINMGDAWPGLRSERLVFPGLDSRPVFPEVIARALETADAQRQMADLIRPILQDAEYVGLPAVLGIHAPERTHAAMEGLIGVKLFEIPTIPPAVPGIRLREMFERELPQLGVRLEPQTKVSKVTFGDSGAKLTLHGAMDDLEVEACAIILATGRFLSGGLHSDRERVCETLLNIPLSQPQGRDDWFRKDYLDPRGHAMNRIGIETDRDFRPVGQDGEPVDRRLFAAGAILAHQDWVRQRCGAGVAIASAYGAVNAARREILAH